MLTVEQFFATVPLETPHMVIFGQKTAYFGSMKPGQKKKTTKMSHLSVKPQSFTETDSALT